MHAPPLTPGAHLARRSRGEGATSGAPTAAPYWPPSLRSTCPARGWSGAGCPPARPPVRPACDCAICLARPGRAGFCRAAT
eukprot:5961970-Pleurochrysis_carterae.AAC.1